MQVTYDFSQPILPVGGAVNTDVLLRFRADEEAAGDTTRRALNLSLVIDRSASMAGSPLRFALQAAESLVDQLQEGDVLSVVMYDDTVDTVLPPAPVTDKDAVKTAIRRIRPGGTTNLAGGWLQGCAHVEAGLNNDRVNRVLLLTDGQANAGITDTNLITQTAKEKADKGIVTTTLGFGAGFNEDLLIGMARAAGGNFYFIQSPDDAADVFSIELQSLKAVAAQNVVATIEGTSGIEIAEVLSSYRQAGPGNANKVVLSLGDLVHGEDKLLALAVSGPAPTVPGQLPLLSVSFTYEPVGKPAQTGNATVEAKVGTLDEAALAVPNPDLLLDISRVRIATAKDTAVDLADKNDFDGAVKVLKLVSDSLRAKGLHERFEVAEELDQLDYFAGRIAERGLDNASRKEMRDQSFQARARNRADLQGRGVASGGSAQSLPKVSEVGSGVELVCVREGGKLRVKVVSDSYDADKNVQFPRAIRDEGVRYVAEKLETSADGSFYRVVGQISRLAKPGEPDRYTAPVRRSSAPAKAPAPTLTAADLETTDSVGDGVLIQVIKEGSKLRARVVSDGFDPNWNIAFPRSIREEGTLYVADEVNSRSDGKSYMASGKIKRFVQS